MQNQKASARLRAALNASLASVITECDAGSDLEDALAGVVLGPRLTVAPVISGSPALGQTLSITSGAWSNSPSSASYQWTRDSVAIAGATSASYTIVEADIGSRIGCRVTVSNAEGTRTKTVSGVLVADSYSSADLQYFASTGPKWPNRAATIGSGFTKAAGEVWLRSPPWAVPAGSEMLVAIPNHYNQEGNSTVNENLLAGDVTIEAVSVTYTDAASVTRTAAATEFSNGGVLSASLNNGGVIATVPLAQAIPANSLIRVQTAYAGASNFSLFSCYPITSSPQQRFRRHASNSFASVVNAGGNLTVSGSENLSLGGFIPGPAFICAKGSDGRPVFYIDGDSIAYGKGTPAEIAPDHVAGIVEPALASTANGYRITAANGTVAGSGFIATDPAEGSYNPLIQRNRRALIDQVTALNGGTPPMTHFLCQHGTNSIGSNTAQHVARIKTRHTWLRNWHNLPVIQTTMIPNASSSDGFTSYAGQTPSGGPTRVGYADELISTLLDGTVLIAVDLMTPLQFGTSTAERQRFALRSFTALLTRDVTAGASTIYLDEAPAIGACLCLDPLSGTGNARIVTAVNVVTAGVEWEVVTTVGASSGTYAAKPAGTAVREIPTSDGVPSTTGLHISKMSNELVAADTGSNSFAAMKTTLADLLNANWT